MVPIDSMYIVNLVSVFTMPWNSGVMNGRQPLLDGGMGSRCLSYVDCTGFNISASHVSQELPR